MMPFNCKKRSAVVEITATLCVCEEKGDYLLYLKVNSKLDDKCFCNFVSDCSIHFSTRLHHNVVQNILKTGTEVSEDDIDCPDVYVESQDILSKTVQLYKCLQFSFTVA